MTNFSSSDNLYSASIPNLQMNYELSTAHVKAVKRIRKTQDSTNLVADIHNESLASEFAKKLIGRLRSFDKALDSQQEVGMKLVSFGQTVKLHVSDVGYHNPGLIIFFGHTDEGHKLELVQHVSQISFLLLAFPKLKPEEPKRPVGFIQEDS
jgi:Family of unknown function (DUF6173)